MIREDNQGCIPLENNWMVNDKTKHIYVKYKLIMDKIQKGLVKLSYITKGDMIDDIITEVCYYLRKKSNYLIKKMGMQN